MHRLTAAETAAALEISLPTLRRWIAAGCPVARRGGCGRGRGYLLDLDAVRAWRAGGGGGADAAGLHALLRDALAAALLEAHAAAEGIDKRRLAGILAASWYSAANSTGDALRASGHAVPEIIELPPTIARLRRIAEI